MLGLTKLTNITTPEHAYFVAKQVFSSALEIIKKQQPNFIQVKLISMGNFQAGVRWASPQSQKPLKMLFYSSLQQALQHIRNIYGFMPSKKMDFSALLLAHCLNFFF